MSFRIVVGLPSWNEADAIAKVTSDIDAALTTLPFAHQAVIVNADNSSTDGTPDVFTAIRTRSAKRVVLTPQQSGKGMNWAAVLRIAEQEQADAVLFVDSDLAEVPQSWIHSLLGGVHDGLDFCYPLRPPTWNGGDLTYQLAYPLLAGVFGVDFREPMCGDIALSRNAVAALNRQEWDPSEQQFGVDFLAATVAITQKWRTVQLTTRRRNKLRSFSTTVDHDYRMGHKFHEVAAAVGHRCAMRTRQQPPEALTGSSAATPVDPSFIVPLTDPDLAALSASTSRRLLDDAKTDAFAPFSEALAGRLVEHATSGAAICGMSWELWRTCLFEWINYIRRQQPGAVPADLLETLFLNRVVGHHHEIAGKPHWYETVIGQAHDTFEHRHALWAGP